MNDLGRIAEKLFVALFSLLFVIPSILFSVLVLGLTDSWKSGTVMLVSSIILVIIVLLNSRNQPSPRRMKKFGVSNEEYFFDFSPFPHPNPPPLSDIYREIDIQHGEAEVLHKLIIQAKAVNPMDHYPYRCSRCDEIERYCKCLETSNH